MQDIVSRCSLASEEGEDDSQFVTILDSEGERVIEGPPLKEVDVTKASQVAQSKHWDERAP